MRPDEYNYESAGFDGFLSRSIDDLSQVNLDSGGPVSHQLAYDRTQVTGMLGDILRLGRWQIDGRNGLLVLYDERRENRIAVLGDIEKVK